MGYTTEFSGSVTVTPPLNSHEVSYLKEFSGTRHVNRHSGPYVADGLSDIQGADIINGNYEHPSQPGLYCDWEPDEDGTAIQWNGNEKFYDPAEWMEYLISTFLKPGATLLAELQSPVQGRHYDPRFAHFSFDHVLDGVIDAQGEDPDDRWRLVVRGNAVSVKEPVITWGDDED